MKNGSSEGFLSPQWRAASYVQRPPMDAPILEVTSFNQSASGPDGSPRDSFS